VSTDREAAYRREAEKLGFNPDAELAPGGNYLPFVTDARTIVVSGQIAREGDGRIVTGRAGEDVSLADAKRAAALSALRILLLLRRAAGSLDRVENVTRIGVLVRCTGEFTQISEVADGASDLLKAVLGESSGHARTSVGVFSLPKAAVVEIEASAVLRA